MSHEGAWIRRRGQLEDENAKLKHLVAGLTLDKTIHRYKARHASYCLPSCCCFSEGQMSDHKGAKLVLDALPLAQ